VNGRDIPNLPGSTRRKRRREDEDDDAEAQRQRLDRALDAFLEDKSDAEQQEQTGEDSRPASPPSKMRSDYIASDGRQAFQGWV
jgi:F0F1-type ATP synthase assembly protein I